MNIEKENYKAVLSNIDEINSKDPNKEDFLPGEQLYSQRMLKTLLKLNPEAEDDLKVACYGQHIKRWAYPRSDYPEGKAGYLRWRKELYNIHGELTAECILKAGESRDFAESVKNIMVNKTTGRGDSQYLEDTACLVFLEYYFDAFIKKHEREKLIKIVVKTWNKMSEKAHEAALKIAYSDEQMALLKQALSL